MGPTSWILVHIGPDHGLGPDAEYDRCCEFRWFSGRGDTEEHPSQNVGGYTKRMTTNSIYFVGYCVGCESSNHCKLKLIYAAQSLSDLTLSKRMKRLARTRPHRRQ